MNIVYVQATPELKHEYQARSGSNATDFIRFEDNYCSLIAMVDDRPIALIVAKKRALAEPLQTVQEAFIDIVEVQPAYQRKGIGTALVQQVIAWARDNQVSQVRAWSEKLLPNSRHAQKRGVQGPRSLDALYSGEEVLVVIVPCLSARCYTPILRLAYAANMPAHCIASCRGKG